MATLFQLEMWWAEHVSVEDSNLFEQFPDALRCYPLQSMNDHMQWIDELQQYLNHTDTEAAGAHIQVLCDRTIVACCFS